MENGVVTKEKMEQRPIFGTTEVAEKFQVIGLLDAGAVVYAADGYTRATDKPAIAITMGKEEAFLGVSACLVAWSDKQPLIILNIVPHSSFEEVARLYAPVTRSSFSIHSTEEAKRVSIELTRAFHLNAVPIQLLVSDGTTDIPALLTMLQPTIEIQKVSLQSPTDEQMDKSIVKIIEFLKGAKNPVILCGWGALRGLSRTKRLFELFKLTKYIGSPLVLSSRATAMSVEVADELRKVLGQFPDVLFLPGPCSGAAWIKAALDADVLLALGTGFSEVDGFGLKDFTVWSSKRTKIICVDISPKLKEGFIVKGRAEEVIPKLLESVDKLFFSANTRRQKWISKLKKIYNKWQEEFGKEATEANQKIPVEPSYAAYEICKNASPNPIFLSEGGASGMWLWTYLWRDGPLPLIFPVQTASIGVTLPMAIGAKIAYPGSAVWGIMGDGASFYHLQELKTAKRLGLPIVLFVFNDRGWGAIRIAQTLSYGRRYIGVDLPDTNFAAIAQSLGCEGIRIQTPKQMFEVLEKLKNITIPTLVDVVIKKDAIPYVGMNFAMPEINGVTKYLTIGSVAGISLAFFKGLISFRQIRFTMEYAGLMEPNYKKLFRRIMELIGIIK